MRRLFLIVLLLFPIAVFAQSDWVSYNDSGCIGGSTCTDRRLRVALDDRPVIGVRFYAHDSIGEKAEGVLRVKIDGNTIDGHVDIPRNGKTFTVDVDQLLGRYLVFEPVNNDEVEISRIQVLYGRGVSRPRDSRGGGGGGGGGRSTGWRPYPSAKGCIGGEECRRNGSRITIALEDQPVLGVRFFAQDNIGTRADGRLNVRIDGNTVQSYIDVKRDGRTHEFEVDSVRGTRLVIETANDDEVEVKDVEVLYGRGGGRRGGGGGNWSREATNEGGCIGGETCGGKRARIRIPIYGRSVAQIRFYARDDVGTRAGGELRIRIDEEVIQDYLDIKREGGNYSFDGRGVSGDYVIIEPAEDDEVVVRDVRVTFAPD
ncbi:MAG: hypothetical protein DMF56_15530 [Acidobacteria bacterium]|nr:MAG: hypothetical protein DMF56_15530 [Acidobacteriota bacterium]